MRILGSVAAAVMLAMAQSLLAGSYVNTYTLTADFDLGVYDGVNATDVADQLQLDKVPTTFPYAWIANAGEGTVSKIDTRTGLEVARYRTGPNGGGESPSRTAVDVNGNCWVANRAFGIWGSVVKILNEGGVNTSTGPGDVKAWGADDRVVLSVQVGTGPNAVPRALAIDKNGDIWVGLYYEQAYWVLNPNDGTLLAQVPVAGYPYGAAIDQKGILWSANLGSGMDKVDTNTRMYVKSYYPGGGYGIVVDSNGFVWLGAYGSGGVWKLNPLTEVLQYFQTPNVTAGRGVCEAPSGNIWVAMGYGSPDNLVAKFRPDGTLLGYYSVGTTPCGVGTDFDGNIIVVCQNSWDVYKLKESDGSVMWHTMVGAGPYTYSDFTGYIVRNITQKTGTWTVIFDSEVPGTPWGMASWNSQEPPETSVTVQVRATDAVSDLDLQSWTDAANAVDFGPINGQYIQVKARLTTTSDVSPILEDITIQAANRPPDCTPAYPSLAMLWPPNNKMVAVQVLGVTDPDGDPLTITIDAIRQDEPVEALGDGNFAPDGQGVGGSTAWLRAERCGTKKVPGDGRVYHVFFTATDPMGAWCSGEVTVGVPHDVKDTPVDGGPLYDSTVGP